MAALLAMILLKNISNNIDYPSEVAIPTGNLSAFKLLNPSFSTTSTVQFTDDVKNFYLYMLLDCPEYIHFHLSFIFKELIEQYILCEVAVDRCACNKVNKACMAYLRLHFLPKMLT